MSHYEKLERARTHLLAFDKTIKDFLAGPDPYSDTTEQHLHAPGEILIKWHLIKQRDLPDDLPVIAGDAIFNMRAALDHLAFALARAHMGDRLKEGGVYFPIHAEKGSYLDAGVRALQQSGQTVQVSLPRFSGRVSDRNYAAACNCSSYFAGLTYPSVE